MTSAAAPHGASPREVGDSSQHAARKELAVAACAAPNTAQSGSNAVTFQPSHATCSPTSSDSSKSSSSVDKSDNGVSPAPSTAHVSPQTSDGSSDSGRCGGAHACVRSEASTRSGTSSDGDSTEAEEEPDYDSGASLQPAWDLC